MMKVILIACLALASHSSILRLGLFGPCDKTPSLKLGAVHQAIAPIRCDQPAKQRPPAPLPNTPLRCDQPINQQPLPVIPIHQQPLPVIPIHQQPLPVVPLQCDQPVNQQPPVYSPPVYSPPVYTPPVYTPPVYTPPVPAPAPAPIPNHLPTPVPPIQFHPSAPAPKLCSCGHHEVSQPTGPIKTVHNDRDEQSSSSEDSEGRKCKSCDGKDCKCGTHKSPKPQPKPASKHLLKKSGKACDKCKDGKCECSDCKCDNCKSDKVLKPIKQVLGCLLHH